MILTSGRRTKWGDIGKEQNREWWRKREEKDGEATVG